MPRTLREIMGSFLRKGDEGHNTVTGFDFRVDPPLTRKRAIRAKCIECQNGQIGEISICSIVDCPLWPWRMGKLRTEIVENEDITDEEQETGDEIALEEEERET